MLSNIFILLNIFFLFVEKGGEKDILGYLLLG